MIAHAEGRENDTLRKDHTVDAISHRLSAQKKHSYLGDFILGAVDGAVTTFAIVAGAAGAGLSNGIVLILGASNVLADGISMAAGNYLRARSDQQNLEKFRRMEEAHISQIPEGEREEVRQIFKGKGFDGELLEQIVEIVTRDRRQWVDTMLSEEWGLQLEPPSPWRAGLVTLVAFVLAGLVPLIPTVILIRSSATDSFVANVILTGMTFFLIGVVRGAILKRRRLMAGLETLLIGGFAASIAFVVGHMLHGLAGVH